MKGSSIWTLPEFKPYALRWHDRQRRLVQLRRYYEGTIYQDTAFKLAHKLYAQTKAMLSFLARAVDLDVALVPGVMGPWELSDKALQQQRDAQATLYEWSAWDIEGDEWLEDGATCGEAAIKIVPDAEQGIVKMQRLRPEHLLYIDKHVVEGVTMPLALIVDPAAIAPNGETYEYAEAITPTEIRTYWNGEPHGYDGAPDRFANPLDFVPVVRVRNDGESRPTFAKCLPQLDSVNELASYLGNIIGRHAEPQWAAFGVEETELTRGNNVWFFPDANSKLEAILAQIDVEGVLAFLQEIKGEVKSNLPELAFDDLRAKDQIATETLEVQLVELDAKIWRMRRRYDAALVDAHVMAATAAMVTGIRDLTPLLAPHSLDYKRPVRPISELDQIRLEEARLSLELQRSISGGDGLTRAAQGQPDEQDETVVAQVEEQE